MLNQTVLFHQVDVTSFTQLTAAPPSADYIGVYMIWGGVF